MKKVLLLTTLSLLLLTPILATADGLVPCGGPGEPQCEIRHFFILLDRIYNFIVWNIATPLAVLMLVLGGIFLMISAGNPNLAGTARKILQWAVIGLILVFGSWVIINFILTTLGYKNWNVL